MVQSRWTPAIWLFPKGGVEENESAREAAVRETREEGGVDGLLGCKLGNWTFTRANNQKQKMWLLHVTVEHDNESKLWKERNKRLRGWYTFDEARAVLTDVPDEMQRPELLEMLEKASLVLNGAGSSSQVENGTTDDDDSD